MTTIELTPTAAQKAAALRDSESVEMALRIEVRSGGCSGFLYEMYFDSDIADSDVTVEYPVEGTAPLKVVTDAASAPMLAGATLEYRDGLTEAGFKITNPNAQRSCGCGKSFS